MMTLKMNQNQLNNTGRDGLTMVLIGSVVSHQNHRAGIWKSNLKKLELIYSLISVNKLVVELTQNESLSQHDSSRQTLPVFGI
ncbi:hypothetical protein HZF08_36325 [Paenibacillus sp. CGMCC 1.16610]|uniref:hypothetical protein n=1 Tax=Paenibacillus sp. CGMCC 1.16610 TaxID=2755557 RepID=UPI0015EF89C0|nr:hypothetical protein [Paenibacillus sp. CGMCC 1.16610]MBA2943743.1 hypothetical protein [Paenibacillus sp. CGMCC 1.16610]